MVIKSENNVLRKYDETSKSWSDVIKVPEWEDWYSAWCTYQSYVIIAGACDRSDSCHVMMVDVKNQLTNLTDFPSLLGAPGLLVADGCLFVVGGYNVVENTTSHRIQLLNIANPNRWDTIKPMPYVVCWPNVTSNRDDIFVFGGFRWSYIPTKHLQIYNTVAQQWTQGTDIPDPCVSITAPCVVQNNMYTIITANMSP